MKSEPLDALWDAGFAGFAGAVAAVSCGNRRQVLATDEQTAAYRLHVQPGATGTRLWTDPAVGTYVVKDEED